MVATPYVTPTTSCNMAPGRDRPTRKAQGGGSGQPGCFSCRANPPAAAAAPTGAPGPDPATATPKQGHKCWVAQRGLVNATGNLGGLAGCGRSCLAQRPAQLQPPSQPREWVWGVESGAFPPNQQRYPSSMCVWVAGPPVSCFPSPTMPCPGLQHPERWQEPSQGAPLPSPDVLALSSSACCPSSTGMITHSAWLQVAEHLPVPLPAPLPAPLPVPGSAQGWRELLRVVNQLPTPPVGLTQPWGVAGVWQ